MKKNVGNTDKIIRIVLGILFIIAAYLWTWWLLIPALISLVTAFTGFCGLYSIFGINTCKIKNKE